MPAAQALFLNREIGILEFNRRVLAQAERLRLSLALRDTFHYLRTALAADRA